MPRGPSPCGCRAALRRGAALPQQPPAGQPTTSTGGSLGHPFEVGLHRFGPSLRSSPVGDTFRAVPSFSVSMSWSVRQSGQPHTGLGLGLWALFDFPVWSGQCSIGQRQRGSGMAPIAFRLPGGVGSGLGRAATGGCKTGWFLALRTLRGPTPSGCRAALQGVAAFATSGRPLEQPEDRRRCRWCGCLELRSASGLGGSHGLDGPVPVGGRGYGVQVGFHRFGPFGPVESGRVTFLAVLLFSALCLGRCASQSTRTGRAWGSGRSSTVRFGWVRVQSGSDNEVGAGLWSFFGDPLGFGPGLNGQRQ
jgi:hypothetical protein